MPNPSELARQEAEEMTVGEIAEQADQAAAMFHKVMPEFLAAASKQFVKEQGLDGYAPMAIVLGLIAAVGGNVRFQARNMEVAGQDSETMWLQVALQALATQWGVTLDLDDQIETPTIN